MNRVIVFEIFCYTARIKTAVNSKNVEEFIGEK